MDAARRCQGRSAQRHGPGAHLVLADREEGLDAQSLISRPDQPVSGGFLDPKVVQKLALVGLVEHGDFLLGGSAEGDKCDAFVAALFAQGLEQGQSVRPGDVAFAEVHHGDKRLAGQEVEVADHLALVVVEVNARHRLEVV